jgi:hypothetical protein
MNNNPSTTNTHTIDKVLRANNETSAKAMFSRAVEEFTRNPGDSAAQFNLGGCYHWGIGVETCCEAAALLYQKASSSGNHLATANLAALYFEGKGVPFDPLKAASLLETAAEAGIVEAMANLGSMLMSGIYADVLGQAREAGIKWLKKAVHHNDIMAMRNLGEAYLRGAGVNVNVTKGRKLIAKADALGIPESFEIGLSIR